MEKKRTNQAGMGRKPLNDLYLINNGQVLSWRLSNRTLPGNLQLYFQPSPETASSTPWSEMKTVYPSSTQRQTFTPQQVLGTDILLA